MIRSNANHRAIFLVQADGRNVSLTLEYIIDSPEHCISSDWRSRNASKSWSELIVNQRNHQQSNNEEDWMNQDDLLRALRKL